ncbi:rhomboid family-domain-containing protein [Dipodascopsis uninucleata]
MSSLFKKTIKSKSNSSDASSTVKGDAYELSQLSASSSSASVYSNAYSDPYADNVPLTDRRATHNPWNERQGQRPTSVAPSTLAGPVIVEPSGRKRIRALPWFVILISVLDIVIFCLELSWSKSQTGSVIGTDPFNPMIGPPVYLFIHAGARFNPCMHSIKGITDSTSLRYSCPARSQFNTSGKCTLSQLCGMGGVDTSPNQWWRFIIPIFLHAGFIHLIVNLMLQIRLGFSVERYIGFLRFGFIYIVSGITGFVLGGSYASDGTPSMGASGALFGILAVQLVDLLLNWKKFDSPKLTLLHFIIEIVIAFAFGLLPGLDNFAHIGGFAMGLILAIGLLHTPDKLVIKDNERLEYYQNPKRFRGRVSVRYILIFFRTIFLLLAAVLLFILLWVFYKDKATCSWCKYLGCLPIHDWCEQGLTTVSP